MSHHAKCARSFQVQSRQDNHLKKIFCASSHRCGLFVVWNNQHFSDAQHTTKEAKDSRIFKKNTFHLLLRIFYHILQAESLLQSSDFGICLPTRSNRFVYIEEMDSGRNINFTTPKSAGWAKFDFFPGLQNLNLNFRTEKGILISNNFAN